MLHNRPNQPTKFRTKIWAEINDDTRRTYNKDSQTKLKNSKKKLKQSLCDYSDAYIRVSGTITVTTQAGENLNNVNKKVVFKNRVSFTDYINEINNTQIDNTKDIDV